MNPSTCQCDGEAHTITIIGQTRYMQCHRCKALTAVELPELAPPIYRPTLFERLAMWLGEGLAEIRDDDLADEIERKRERSLKILFCVALTLLMSCVIFAVLIAPSAVK